MCQFSNCYDKYLQEKKNTSKNYTKMVALSEYVLLFDFSIEFFTFQQP